MRKRFLILLLGLFLLPTAVQAETIYLLLRDGYLEGTALEKIPMESIGQCEEAGALFVSSERLYRTNERRGFECLVGK